MKRLSLLCLLFTIACGSEPEQDEPLVLQPDMGEDSGMMNEDMSSNTDMSDMEEDMSPPGPNLDVPEKTWTWLPIDGMKCANNSPTGIGINYNPDSSDLVFYLAGGGACWDTLTCYQFSTAVNIADGYDETKFNGVKGFLQQLPLFDRSLETNPMKDATFVAVPYCTGDVHAGTKMTNHGGTDTHHVGYNNITAILDALDDDFQGAKRIVMSGSSAGAYGASMNMVQTRERFPGARIDLINDGGPPMKNMNVESTWRAAWGLDAIIPADCDACKTSLRGVLDYVIEKDTDARVGLLSYTQDSVISQFYGLDATTFEQQLGELRTESFDPHTNAKVFYVPGSQHTMFSNLNGVTQSGTTAWSWIQSMLSDNPEWESLAP